MKTYIYIFIFLLNLFNINICYANTINKNLSSLENVLHSVVNVYVERFNLKKDNSFKNFFKYKFGKNLQNKKTEGLGSGIIIDSKNGYIVTNYHVINNSNLIKIGLYDKREFYAKVIGINKRADIALLKIFSFENIKEIKISNSNDIKIGDPVMAIGNPFGLGQTTTSGIISAIGRSGISIGGLENFIQTDAHINKGNSGGALINNKYELIGMNTAILAPNGGSIGIGFAIPSNIIKLLINQIINDKIPKNGYLGIKGSYLNIKMYKELNNFIYESGVFVNKIVNNSPAYKAGIKCGDIILSLNGINIKSSYDLKMKIFMSLPKNKVNLKILRNDEYIYIDVILEDYKYTLNKKDNKKYSFQF